MIPPSITEQKGLAFAHMPFAIISFFSSSYVIYYLLRKERQKLNRLYHRLVLAMNFAITVLSVVWVWRPFAVPEGTPYYAAAAGSIQTCTASGFLFVMLTSTVPIYYTSLSLQAYVSLKHNFKEEEYRWIEKYIHLVAWCWPCIIATVFAADENYIPGASGCYVATSNTFFGVVLYFMISLEFIFTPSLIIAIYCHIGKQEKKIDLSRGMQKIRESAKKQLMRSAAVQMSVYYISYLITHGFVILYLAYAAVTGTRMYNLLILSSSLLALQGFVCTMVYFTLQRLGNSKVEPAHPTSETVEAIRSRAQQKSEIPLTDVISDSIASTTFTFNIFDGIPDENSPWARYIDMDDCSTNEDLPDEGEAAPNDHV